MQEAIRKVAVTNANVLLEGESGTGKELFARTIHQWGPKKHERFLAANCASGPADAIERNAVWLNRPRQRTRGGRRDGHLASRRRRDRVPRRNRPVAVSTQAKLLRAIEYGEIMPVGGSEPQRHHARLIVATTHDLAREVAEKRFDENLFYRLDGVRIHIPPLRDRLDDIPELVEFFVAKHSRAMGQRVTGATSETIRLSSLPTGRATSASWTTPSNAR